MDEWIKKMYLYIDTDIDINTDIHDGILLNLRKKEILLFVTAWINLEDILISKINKAQGQILCYLTYMPS
jgi:hypothetical protein